MCEEEVKLVDMIEKGDVPCAPLTTYNEATFMDTHNATYAGLESDAVEPGYVPRRQRPRYIPQRIHEEDEEEQPFGGAAPEGGDVPLDSFDQILQSSGTDLEGAPISSSA